jgi:catechol 2,3-dioxygenase-like lactoylglutathione lyase family enzyme
MTAREYAIPILASLDFEETIAFYGALGFEKMGVFPDYALIRRGAFEIHFWLCPDRAICEATACYLQVADAKAMYEEWAAALPAGGRVEAPTDTDYGMREFPVWDPHGNLIRVGQVLAGGSA